MLRSSEIATTVEKADAIPITRQSMWRWLLSWEAALIFVLALFFYLYKIEYAEFDFDQAMLWRLAHDAIAHGMLPLTSNTASVGYLNPPFFVYLLMPAAAISSNPIGGAITVALFSIATTLLVYLFTRRYFGRFTAIIATLLALTAAVPYRYTRSIWQPDVLPFFMILFMFAMYHGGVQHKKGWLWPALALTGIIYQLHPSSAISLTVLIVLTIALAPETIRVRDVAYSVLALLVVFFPYVLWQFQVHFQDIQTLMKFASKPAKIDKQVVTFYTNLMEPTRGLQPRWMPRLHALLLALLLGGVLSAGILLSLAGKQQSSARTTRFALLSWWHDLRFDPLRSSLLILLVWQIFPFIYLFRHSVDLHMQYMLVFMPGPFILIALCLTSWLRVVQKYRPALLRLAHIGVAFVATMLILLQFASITFALLQNTSGKFNDKTNIGLYINDSTTMLNVANRVDQLAQERKLSRAYIAVDFFLQDSLGYLSEQMRVPTTVYSAKRCLVLPDPSAGPALLLVGPYDTATVALLQHYAKVTLLEEPPRLSGSPFKLYQIEPKALAQTLPANFTTSLQVIDRQAESFQMDDRQMVGVRWQLQNSLTPQPRVNYSYQVDANFTQAQQKRGVNCALSATRAGDQLVTVFDQPKEAQLTKDVQLRVSTATTGPAVKQFGPITTVSGGSTTGNQQRLRTPEGGENITLPVTQSKG